MKRLTQHYEKSVASFFKPFSIREFRYNMLSISSCQVRKKKGKQKRVNRTQENMPRSCNTRKRKCSKFIDPNMLWCSTCGFWLCLLSFDVFLRCLLTWSSFFLRSPFWIFRVTDLRLRMSNRRIMVRRKFQIYDLNHAISSNIHYTG